MSKHRPDDDYRRVAARMALQMRVSHAAARLTRQMLDLYLGLAQVTVETWEQPGAPSPGYRIAVEIRFADPEIAHAAERRRVSDIIKAATDRHPFILDLLDDGVRGVVAFAEPEGEATLVELGARDAAGSLDSVH
jgi:hypothetical protein